MAERRSNRDRSNETRGAMLAAARRLFVEQGYADTATPDIVAAAGVTRGALYHHFDDKLALFRAVVEAELDAVAADIDRGADDGAGAIEALLAGARAYLRAMREPGRVRLLLVDGPAVLGRAGLDAIEISRDRATLRNGLTSAIAAGKMPDLPVGALEILLSAAFDRAALAVAAGAPDDEIMAGLEALFLGLAALPGARTG